MGIWWKILSLMTCRGAEDSSHSVTASASLILRLLSKSLMSVTSTRGSDKVKNRHIILCAPVLSKLNYSRAK